MGGYGSGKSYGKGRKKRGKHLLTSDLPQVNITKLLRSYHMRACLFIWNVFIKMEIKEDSILVSHICNEYIKTPVIKYVKIPCHYGGFRFLGECPCCQRRIKILYFHEALFACRRCFKIVYQSQNANLSSRLYFKKKEVEKKISGDVWNKPKWMKQKTFARFRKEIFELEEKIHLSDFFSSRTLGQVRELFKKYPVAFMACP